MDRKILYAILMIIPFVSGVGACFYAKEYTPNDLEWYLVLGSVIPFINLICAIILLVMLLLKKF